MKNVKLIFLVILIFFPSSTFSQKNKSKTSSREITNIAAFGRAYGIVRFFYPSQNLQELNWNDFLVYGINEVKNAKSDEELILKLEKLFFPITLRISFYKKGKNYEFKSDVISQGDSIVYWQHIGLSNIGDSYFGETRISLKNDRRELRYCMFDSSLVVRNGSRYTIPIPDTTQINYLETKNYILNIQPSTLPYVEEITNDIYISCPIVLPIKSERLFLNKTEIQKLNLIYKNFSDANKNDTSLLFYADFIYVWTVISHFYPYKKSLELVLDFNWDSQLLVGLNEMSLVENFDDALKILNKSVNMFQDIHTYIYNFKNATDFAEKASFLPIYTECVDKRIFVVKSYNEKIKKGDEILMIDGKSISYLLDSLEEKERGTVRYKRGSAFNGLSFIKNQFQVELKRNNINLSLTIKPISIVEYFSKLIYENPYNHKSIEQVNPTTYYINLGKASEDEWKASFNALSKTENIIIDLRDYLFVGHEEFLFHFIKRGYLNGMYYCSPVNIYPNQKSTYYPFETDIIYSNEPVIKTKISLLINANTMSKGEIICSVLKANGATLYGDTTAGAPGTLAGTHSLITPSNSLFVLSTRYILRSNLQQMQLIGITPDIRVLPIVKDLQEGKDSVLEQVLRILNKN